MRRLVLRADLSFDSLLVRDETAARWAQEHADRELVRYQERVVQKAGVHALEEAWSVDALAELKADGGDEELAPIVAEGGARFCQELTRRRLVDEYRVVVHPVVLGEGQRLFTVPDRLYVISTRYFAHGVVAHTLVPVAAYQDHPPPYPWASLPWTQGPGQHEDDSQPEDPAQGPAPG